MIQKQAHLFTGAHVDNLVALLDAARVHTHVRQLPIPANGTMAAEVSGMMAHRRAARGNTRGGTCGSYFLQGLTVAVQTHAGVRD